MSGGWCDSYAASKSLLIGQNDGTTGTVVLRSSKLQHPPVNLLAVAGEAQVLEHRRQVGLDEIVEAFRSVDLDSQFLVEIDEPLATGEPHPVMCRPRLDVYDVSGADARRDGNRFHSSLLSARPVDFLKLLLVGEFQPVEAIVGF